MFESIKRELNNRKREKEYLKEAIEEEKARIEERRKNAKKSVFRKVKWIDDYQTKREKKADARQIEIFSENGEKAIKIQRKRRRDAYLRANKGKIGIAAAVVLVIAGISGFAGVNSYNQEMAERYDLAVSYILDENYKQAKEELAEIDTEETTALIDYCDLQTEISSYEGNPNRFQKQLNKLDGIENAEVEEQINDVQSQIELAINIQEDIDSINSSEVRLKSKDDVEQITDEIDEIDDRYVNLLDTNKYDDALITIENLEEKTDVGKTILAIDKIGDVSLSSEGAIKKARDKYDDLSYSDQQEVVNSEQLLTAEEQLKKLKEEKAAKEKAERKKREAKERAEREKREAKEALDNTAVYLTPTGKCYHIYGCGTIKGNCWETTLKEADAAGYRPCGVCHPPRY